MDFLAENAYETWLDESTQWLQEKHSIEKELNAS